MIMNINEDVYAANQMHPELEAAYNSMDSDCCPDPQQYLLTPNDSQQHPPAQLQSPQTDQQVQQAEHLHQEQEPSSWGADFRSEYCTEFCG